MKITASFSLKQRAEKWVSTVVLLGCVLITVGLVYLTFSVSALGEGWVEDRNAELETAQDW